MTNIEKHYNNIFKKLDDLGEKSYLMGINCGHFMMTQDTFFLPCQNHFSKMFDGLNHVLEVGW